MAISTFYARWRKLLVGRRRGANSDALIQDRKAMIRFPPSIRFTVLVALAVASAYADAPLLDGEGKQLTMRVCNTCHGIKVVANLRLTKKQWAVVVDKMALEGATATDAEFDTIIDYLATNLGKIAPVPTNSDERPAKLNLNHATEGELERVLTLPRSEVEAIIQYREEKGPYKDFEDLKKIPGFDIKKIEAQKDRLIF
jgi:competence protein ComEA